MSCADPFCPICFVGGRAASGAVGATATSSPFEICHRCECARCRRNRLRELEFGEDGRAIPVIPPLDVPSPPVDPNPVFARCGVCALELRRVMNFVCANPRCPCFPRVTCSTSNPSTPNAPLTVTNEASDGCRTT